MIRVDEDRFRWPKKFQLGAWVADVPRVARQFPDSSARQSPVVRNESKYPSALLSSRVGGQAPA